MADADYIGRFAPSPTGPLHAGSLLAAAASYLDARQAGGLWYVRIEDIDPPREIPGASDDILHTLERFGFLWDGPVVYQSTRLGHYRDRLDEVASQTFWCPCTRRELSAARAVAGIDDDRYPGTCRRGQNNAGAVRFRHDQPVAFTDRILGDIGASPGPDDFVIWRKDGLPSYQWAVSIDDAEQGITHVVRGADLLHTTPRQFAVLNALNARLPRVAHVPMVVHADGHKLSKQTGAPALGSGLEVTQLCAAFTALGLPVERASTPDSLAELWLWGILHWNPKRLKKKRTIPFVN